MYANATKRLAGNTPGEPRASKMEPKVIVIQAKKYPSTAPWSNMELGGRGSSL